MLVVSCPKSAAKSLWLITKMIDLCTFSPWIAMAKFQRMVWWTRFLLVYQVFSNLFRWMQVHCCCVHILGHVMFTCMLSISLYLNIILRCMFLLSLFFLLGLKHGLSWQSSLDHGFYFYFYVPLKTRLRGMPSSTSRRHVEYYKCMCTVGHLVYFKNDMWHNIESIKFFWIFLKIKDSNWWRVREE